MPELQPTSLRSSGSDCFAADVGDDGLASDGTDPPVRREARPDTTAALALPAAVGVTGGACGQAAECEAATASPTSASSTALPPPTPPSAFRVQLQGAELVKGRQAYTVYRLLVEAHVQLPLLYRRFSQFAELLARMSSPAFRAASKLPLTVEQSAELEMWNNRSARSLGGRREIGVRLM